MKSTTIATTEVNNVGEIHNSPSKGHMSKVRTDSQSGSHKHRFKFEGKRYSLIKRNQSRDGAWWLETIIQGQRIVRSLKTNIAATAEQSAIDDYIKPAKAGNWTAVENKKSGSHKHHFKFEGRRYKLFKRNKTRDGAWWLEAIIHGQRIVRSLDTNVAAAAEQRAIADFIKPAKAGNWTAASGKKLRDSFSNIGAVFACYRSICVGRLPDKTVGANLNSFRLVVRRGKGDDGISNQAVEALSSSVLTGKLVADFEDWMAVKAVADGRDLEANKRSVEGYLRQARSLFKATALPRYAEKNVHLPDLKSFMERAVERPAKIVRQPADDKLLANTFKAAQQLRLDDRPAYLAFLLGLCSLRRGEISRMKWEWVKVINERPCIVIPAEETKSGAARMIPIDPRVAQEVEAYKPERRVGLNLDEEQYVLPSPRMGQGKLNCRLRAQNVFKRASAFMRAQGWTTNHTLHEMRALALSLVRDNYGLDTAQAVAGHSDQKTTQAHYVGMKSVRDVTITLPLAIGN